MNEDKYHGIIDYTAMQCREELEKIELEKLKVVFDKYRPSHDADEKTKDIYKRMVKQTEELFVRRFHPISDRAKAFFQQYLKDE